MRVLALTSLYPNPWQPNRTPFNRRQFRILAQNHCPVRVISPISWTDELRARRSGKPALPPGRQVELDGLTVDHPRVYFAPGVLRSWYGRAYLWSVHSTFSRVLKEFKPTIVYAPWIYPDGWAAIQLARDSGLPVALKAHGSDILLLDQNPGRRPGTVAALRSADGIIAVSRDLGNKMIALGADPGRVRVIYNGLERHLFQPGSKAAARQALGLEGTHRRLLFIGNLLPVKGIDVLLRACAKLKDKGLDYKLHIVGEGPLKQQLIGQAEALHISSAVVWHGGIPQVQLPDWYRAADVFVLPSRSEGVPNVLLEASGCHTPWVATRVGGIPEIQHLGINQIVSPECSEELATAIMAMLDSAQPCGELPRPPEAAVLETFQFLKGIQVSRQSSKRLSVDAVATASLG